MTDSDFIAKILELRQIFEDFGRTIDEHGGDGAGFVPSQDSAFWQDVDRIDAAGRDRTEAEVPWLASLTQVDDLGPNGRALFLATTALFALGQMPDATLAIGRTLWTNLAPQDSIYRKVGVCKVLEASASAQAIPLLESLVKDENTYVQREARWCLKRLQETVASTKGEILCG